MIKPTIWLEARERSAAARERCRRQVLEEVETVLQSLADKYQWDELYLFGSLVSPGRFSSDSDIDIAVSGLDKHALLSFIAEASRELGREVDVLRLEEMRAFRHVFRHAYSYGLDDERVFFLLRRVLDSKDIILGDISSFRSHVEELPLSDE